MRHIPLTLYIHIPWCVKKCPYCDFNSHQLKTDLPEQDYVQALLADLQQDLAQAAGREVEAIFMGGGTPSLFSPTALHQLLQGIRARISVRADAEITLEANPGTVEQQRFIGFREAGINRLSVGVQSFQADKLKALGRIHDDEEASNAISAAKNAGFSNFNIDLMYGLPQQSNEDALYDLQTALSLAPTHLSWYQLTLEPNTAFFHAPPLLPGEDESWEMQVKGQAFLAEQGFAPYEISAYTFSSPLGQPSQHNLNYWQFGDYLGIGAGAHSKMTDRQSQAITRTWKVKHPRDYLNPKAERVGGRRVLPREEIAFEFMLNALRLYQPVSYELFEERTGLGRVEIMPILGKAQEKGLLCGGDKIETTALGKRYLNDLLALFL
jgi:putative oxygen-independent coproporphyrinogen III oxidase